MQRRGRWLLIALGSCLLVACSNSGEVTVRNSSGEKIVEGLVTVSGQQFPVGQLEPGATTSYRFRIHGDSSYGAKIRFASGRSLEKSVGYVTNGLDVKDEIEVFDDHVRIRSLAVTPRGG